MTTNKGSAHGRSIPPLLVAGEWGDYANIAHLTDRDHRLPDWILRIISGQKRILPTDDKNLLRLARAYVRRSQDEEVDVEFTWRFMVLCQEIGLRQVMSEYENQRETNGVEESDQPS